MLNGWTLPQSIKLGGIDYKINTHYGAVLDLFAALNDPECFGDSEEEKKENHAKLIFEIMIPDCYRIPREYWQEAINKVCEFIDMGIKDDGSKKHIKTMDWEQDAPILIPAINKVLGTEIRSVEYMHWWTFLGAYMEIRESLFSNVVYIRQKKAKNKKLEKNEQEFYKENKNLIDFEKKSQRSEEEKKALDDYFYGYKKNK